MARPRAKAEISTEPIVRSRIALPITIKTYRLGIFDTLDDTVPIKFIGLPLTDCPTGLAIIRETISGYNAAVAKRPGCTYAMGVFGAN